MIRTGCGSGCAVPAPPVRARCPGAGVRPLPRSREALSPVSSNRPDLRGIHAVFCLSFHPSCRLVASGRQSRWLLRRARLHTKTQKETQFAERHSSSLCFSGTARAPAAKLLLIVLSIIPPKTVKVSAESFFFPIFFFQTNGRTCPTTVAVPP